VNKAVRKALWAKLNAASGVTNLLGDPATGYSESIYHALAPPGATYPLVIFHEQAKTRYMQAFADKSGRNSVWLVKAVAISDTADAVDDIADAIEAALGESTLSITGGSLYRMAWESDVQFTEDEDGQMIRHSGGLYRVSYRTP
jgi:hypothetical protein